LDLKNLAFNFLFDFLLPRFCTACEKKLTKSEKVVCDDCFKTVKIASLSRLQNEYIRKFSNENIISGFSSAFVFSDDSSIQKLIHSLKYDQNYQVGIFLGIKTALQLRHVIKKWNADYLLPVPLHSIRKAERGFNQANEITKGVSRKTDIPIKSKIIKRIKNTQTQTKFTLNERKENIHNAFRLSKKKAIAGKRIILVDDVITTGATSCECARLLVNNGAEAVYLLSVAIAN